MRRALAFIAALTIVTSAQASEAPRKAFGRFTSWQYNVTFIAPPGLFYCRLPADWVGSDHGTVLFFERPRRCTGVGYPSSGRGFEPAVPRIEIYYGHEVVPPEPEPCRKTGSVRLIGKIRPVCAKRAGTEEVRTVRATYDAGTDNEIYLTLVTGKTRLKRDYATFVRLAQAIGMCRSSITLKGRTRWSGHGSLCREGNFY